MHGSTWPGGSASPTSRAWTELAITVGGQSFPHLLYHFVLTYSNWESVTLCFSESFEALSKGLQNGLWELSGVSQQHSRGGADFPIGNYCPLVNRSSTATSKAARATDRHLNLADIDGMLLSTGLRMVLMCALSSEQHEGCGVVCSQPACGTDAAPFPGPSTKRSTSCHRNHRETGRK